MVSFALQKLCNFMRYHLSILDLRAYAIGVLFRKFPSVQIPQGTPQFLFYKFQSVWLYVEVLDPFGVELSTRRPGWINLHSSACWPPVEPAPFVEKPIFFPLDVFSSFVENQMAIGVWVHFWIFNPVPLILLRPQLLIVSLPGLNIFKQWHPHSSEASR